MTEWGGALEAFVTCALAVLPMSLLILGAVAQKWSERRNHKEPDE